MRRMPIASMVRWREDVDHVEKKPGFLVVVVGELSSSEEEEEESG